MFDRFITVHDNKNAVKAANIMTMSIEKHNETLRSISDSELKVRDRVDISLNEYEKLKRELSILRTENCELKHMFQSMGIPVDTINDIVPDSISVRSCKSYVDFKTLFQVTFAVYDNGRRTP